MYRLSLALRYFCRRKVAYVSVLAIAAGVMAMIVVNSVMEGFQRRIKDSIFRVDGSLKASMGNASPERMPEYYEMMVAQLGPFMESNGGPIEAVSKRLVQPAMLYTRATRPYVQLRIDVREQFIRLIGIDIDLERKVLPFDELLDAVNVVRRPGESVLSPEGQYRWNRRVPDDPETRAEPFNYVSDEGIPAAQPGIILGSQLAKHLYVEAGDLVQLITARRDDDSPDGQGLQTRERRFVVTGCFESGRYEYDKSLAFCDSRVLQDMLGWASDCSEIRIKIADPDSAQLVKEQIEKETKHHDFPLYAYTWKDQMRSLAEALEFEKLAMGLVTAFVVIVAGVSIGGLLYMVVLEKTRDIGILTSMGATSGGIVSVFMLYGGLLGLIGTGLGVFLGIEVVENLNNIIHWLEDIFDREFFPPDVYEFGSLPRYFDVETITTYALFTFGWCLVVSIIPAFFASRLDPLKCLSYE